MTAVVANALSLASLELMVARRNGISGGAGGAFCGSIMTVSGCLSLVVVIVTSQGWLGLLLAAKGIYRRT